MRVARKGAWHVLRAGYIVFLTSVHPNFCTLALLSSSLSPSCLARYLEYSSCSTQIDVPEIEIPALYLMRVYILVITPLFLRTNKVSPDLPILQMRKWRPRGKE